MEMAIRECADHEDRKGQQRREKGLGCDVEGMAIHDALFFCQVALTRKKVTMEITDLPASLAVGDGAFKRRAGLAFR